MALVDAIKALGPSGYWRLNEPSGFGTGFADLSGGGHNGVAGFTSGVNSATTYSLPTKGAAAPYVVADHGSGYNNVASASFSGSNAINLPAGSWLSNLTFSSIALIKTANTGAIQVITSLRKWNSPGYNFWWLAINTAGLLNCNVWDSGGSGVASNLNTIAVVADNTWHFVALTHQETVATVLYIDGAPAASVTPTGASHTDSTTPLGIGCDQTNSGRAFSGLMAENAYFGNKVLTADDIAALYKEWKRGGVVL